MIDEIRQLNPKPGLAFGSTLVQPIVPGCVRAPGPRRRLHHRAQFRHLAQGAGQPELPCGNRQEREERQGQDLSRRLSADRHLADPRARPARQDHPESLDRDRAPAGRVLRPRRPASAAAQSQDHRRCDRHARIDGVAGHRQQVHGDQPRHLRAQVFLHLGDRGGGRRRSALGGSRAPPHQAIDRRRKPGHVLSDDTIVEKLREAGIDIARRTVAKYREAMRIASSVQRRREKQTSMGLAP